MSTVTTTKVINPSQFAGEIGAGCTVADNGTTRTITANVAQAALQAAVDSHVAVNEQANRTTLEQQAVGALDTNRTFLAIASPTNAQIVAQVKALTRQNNGFIRLILGRLDGTS